MNTKLESLTTEQLMHLLTQERRKFLLALDFGATGSDLQEIRDVIKELEAIIKARESNSSSQERSRPEGRSSVA